MSELEDAKKVSIGGRAFEIHVKRFSNGCFLAISEGETMRLGALELSIKTEQITSSTIIPPRFSSTFLAMLAEMAANVTGGIAVVSLYLTKDIGPEIVKKLISEARSMLSTQKS